MEVSNSHSFVKKLKHYNLDDYWWYFLILQILGIVLELGTIKSLQKIAWAASCKQLRLVHATNDDIHRHHDIASANTATSPSAGAGDAQLEVSSNGSSTSLTSGDDTQVCREALEVLAVALTLNPQALDGLNKDKAWQTFIIDILLLSKSR